MLDISFFLLLFYYRTDDLFDIHIHVNVNVVHKNSATQGSIVVGTNGLGGQAISSMALWVCHLISRTIFMLLIRRIVEFKSSILIKIRSDNS
jgi:hypothetical protein